MSARPLIYLAGPIAGANEEQLGWRTVVARRLVELGYRCLSPMRGKEALPARAGGRVPTDYRAYADTDPFHSSQGILLRDFNDVRRAELLFVNLTASTDNATPSYGTIMELAWAHALRTPVVALVEPESFVFSHPLLSQAVGPFHTPDLEEAILFADLVLGENDG